MSKTISATQLNKEVATVENPSVEVENPSVEVENPSVDETANEESSNDSLVDEFIKGDKTLSFNDRIKAVLDRGGKRYNDLRVKNVKSSIEESDSGVAYVRITFVCDRAIPAFVASEEDEEVFIESISNNIFCGLYSLCGMLKEYEEYAWVANELIKAGEKALDEDDDKYLGIINLIFNSSRIDVLSELVSTEDTYVNPFTTNTNPEEYTPEHDIYMNNIVNIKVSKHGEKVLDRLIDKLLEY